MDEDENKVVVQKTVTENNTGNVTRQGNENMRQTDGRSVYKETVVANTDEGNLKARKVVYFILGLVDILLIIRFILRLLGANPANEFVKIIYAITNALLWPFSGIFSSAVFNGIETKSVMEPATLIAIVVYALVAWGIVKLIEIFKSSKITRA